MRLDEAVELFLDTYNKASTRDTYRKAMKTVLEVVGQGRDINDITPADLVRVQSYLQKRGYSAATLRQRITSTKSFFSWLKKMELAEENPARVVKAPPRRRPQTRAKAMTDEELQLLLEYARFHCRRDHALFSFLADTGCRVGGAAALRVPDLDLDNRRATVTEKGDKIRLVAYGLHTSRLLRQYLIWRKATRGDYVFSLDGGPIKSETLSQRVRRACKALRKQGIEIRILSAHSFRHRKGHAFADARINPAVAATALGHDSVMTTLEYYYPDDWESAARALDELALKPDHSRKSGAE